MGQFAWWFPWQTPIRDLNWVPDGRESATTGSHDRLFRPAGRRPAGMPDTRNELNERKSAQLRPLGHHRPVAAGVVHPVPKPEPADAVAGNLVLAAPQRG